MFRKLLKLIERPLILRARKRRAGEPFWMPKPRPANDPEGEPLRRAA